MKVGDLLLERQRLQYERKDFDQALKILNSKCGDALWMLERNKPIWRGSDDSSLRKETTRDGFAIVDPSKTERKSMNTSNHYTLIIDNSPAYKGWPKRSRSMICAAGSDMDSKGHAEDYGDLYAVIPFDGVKIGCVNKGDIWETELKVFNDDADIEDLNHTFKDLKVSDKSWERFLQDVRNLSFDKFAEYFLLMSSRAMSPKEKAKAYQKYYLFVDTLLDSYAPEKLKFTLHTTATLGNTRGEVWVSGPCLMMRESIWMEMVKMNRTLRK